jgi:hypothetical protein
MTQIIFMLAPIFNVHDYIFALLIYILTSKPSPKFFPSNFNIIAGIILLFHNCQLFIQIFKDSFE